MTKLLKFQWAFVAVAATALAVGTAAYEVSSEPARVVVELSPGAKAQVQLLRVFPSFVHAELEFARRAGVPRPELGDYRIQGDFRSTGKLIFPDPGALVKVEVQVLETGARTVFEARPAGSANGSAIWRGLTPFVDDGDPHMFTWTLPASAALPLQRGRSTLTITVLDVDSPLVGEKVTLVVEGPVGFKQTESGYAILWWFMLWPLFAPLLVLYAFVLLRLTRRQRRTDAAFSR